MFMPVQRVDKPIDTLADFEKGSENPQTSTSSVRGTPHGFRENGP